MAAVRVTSLGAAQLWLTDRRGGVSAAPYDALNLGDHVGDDPAAVEENRRLLAAQVSVPRERLALMRQVHGARVVVLDGRAAPRPAHRPADAPAHAPADAPADAAAQPPEADALVTGRPGLALTVLVADCVPVLLASNDPGVVGVAHAGRRGMAGGVVAATLAAMATLGADPTRTVAHVGPSICGRCYEVPADLQTEVGATVPASVTTTRSGSTGLDLRAGVVAQLGACGVGAVTVDHRCTAESDELYSHRRDGVTGRFAGVALVALRD